MKRLWTNQDRRTASQVLAVALTWGPPVQAADPADPRLRALRYDPQTVVSVPVRRGVVTLVVLDADEAITEVAAGLGGDCSRPEAAWCISAQVGARHFFVKPKSGANQANNLAVLTDRRAHAFRFVVLTDADPQAPVHRLSVQAAPLATLAPSGQAGTRTSTSASATASLSHPAAGKQSVVADAPQMLAQADLLQALVAMPALPTATATSPDLLAERLQARPAVMNTDYSLAEGAGAQDILPTLVFDDGRFTYLRFPGQRDVPAVFHVLPDGGETLANTRMDGDLLVVDRVSRRLVLRAGSAVVGIWNDGFDLDGAPVEGGTTVPGVDRVLKANGTVRAPAEVRSAPVPAASPALTTARNDSKREHPADPRPGRQPGALP